MIKRYFHKLHTSHWRIVIWVFALIFLSMYPSMGYIGRLSVVEHHIRGSIVDASVKVVRNAYARVTIWTGSEEVIISVSSREKSFPLLPSAIRRFSVGDVVDVHQLEANYGGSKVINFKIEKYGQIFS